MKVRLKFSKKGPMKFIGHLDTMRYFQKAIRRSDTDIAFSQGFSPHPVQSFASPLGVGLTSDGEYMDIQLNCTMDAAGLVERLNAEMCDNIHITGVTELSEQARNSMSLVAGADYLVSLKDGYCFSGCFSEMIAGFLEQPQIIIQKKTKKSSQEANIRPMIWAYAFTAGDFIQKGGTVCSESTADRYENGNRIYFKLAAGSVNNLKPELVVEAFCNHALIAYTPYAWQVHRLELYGEELLTKKLLPIGRLTE